MSLSFVTVIRFLVCFVCLFVCSFVSSLFVLFWYCGCVCFLFCPVYFGCCCCYCWCLILIYVCISILFFFLFLLSISLYFSVCLWAKEKNDTDLTALRSRDHKIPFLFQPNTIHSPSMASNRWWQSPSTTRSSADWLPIHSINSFI